MCDGRRADTLRTVAEHLLVGLVQFAPFTGYACVIISMNYRRTYRTTDGSGPHVSNTNVSLHKSIMRNIFSAFKHS